MKGVFSNRMILGWKFWSPKMNLSPMTMKCDEVVAIPLKYLHMRGILCDFLYY